MRRSKKERLEKKGWRFGTAEDFLGHPRGSRVDRVAELRRALGRRAPPKTIWQWAFDHDNDHLRRLARLQPDAKPDAMDLVDYALDIRYEEVQKDLLLWLLPFCLRAWRDDLRGVDASHGGFVEQLYPALVDGGILDRVLGEDERAAVALFMREAILEEIDDQAGLSFSGMRARPYRWVYALTTYGVLQSDLEQLWTDWWAVGTRGRAVAAVQYISCLAYGEDENPVFAPWTREGGGGPPELWEFAGHLYTHRWLEPNVRFLVKILDPTTVTEVLRSAVARLATEVEGDQAGRVLAGLATRTPVLAHRCEELPRILAEARQPGVLRRWSRSEAG